MCNMDESFHNIFFMETDYKRVLLNVILRACKKAKALWKLALISKETWILAASMDVSFHHV